MSHISEWRSKCLSRQPSDGWNLVVCVIRHIKRYNTVWLNHCCKYKWLIFTEVSSKQSQWQWTIVQNKLKQSHQTWIWDALNTLLDHSWPTEVQKYSQKTLIMLTHCLLELFCLILSSFSVQLLYVWPVPTDGRLLSICFHIPVMLRQKSSSLCAGIEFAFRDIVFMTQNFVSPGWNWTCADGIIWATRIHNEQTHHKLMKGNQLYPSTLHHPAHSPMVRHRLAVGSPGFLKLHIWCFGWEMYGVSCFAVNVKLLSW